MFARLGAGMAVLCWAARVPALVSEVGGHTVDLGGHLEAREVFKVDEDTPDDGTSIELSLRLRAEISDAVSFESTAVGRWGGPTTNSTGAGIYTLDDVFQSRSPALDFEEAFLDVGLKDLDLRIGKQKLAWGKLDRFQAVDVLNPERFNDPFLLEENERKIGTPAVLASYFPPFGEELRASLVWIPQYFPFRFSRQGERWFPPAATPPSVFEVPEGIFLLPNGEPNPAFSVPIAFRTRNVAPPDFKLRNSGYGLRLGGFAGGLDYDLYFYHGFDSQPAFELSVEARADPDPASPLGLDFSGATELQPVFRRIDLWGADGAYAWGPVTMRAEAAYVRGRPFSRDLRFLIDDPRQLAPQIADAVERLIAGEESVPIDVGPSFVRRDAIEWGVGVDYTRAGYLLLLQVNQTDVLSNDVDLLIANVETRLLANLRKNFWHDDLQLQLIGQHSFESDYTLLMPRVTYRLWRGLQLRVGYLFIAGRRSSLIGQYKDNDQAFLRARYLF
jgi:hypothetical protein